MGAPVTLVWPGRRWTRDASEARDEAAGSIRTLERHGDDAGALRYALGDVLEVAAMMRARGERADLVYIDPPFASQRAYAHEARLDGVSEDGGGRVVRGLAYDDSQPIGAYLEELAPRLEALCGVLSRRGTIWVHLDWRAAYLVRVLLDEILGRERFLNEIVWRRAPNLGRQAASGQFGRTLDTLLVYGNADAVITPPTRPERIDDKAVRFDDEGRAFTTAPRGDYTDASIARLEREGRVHRTSTGRVYVKYFLTKTSDGGYARERRVDALWTDVPALRHAPPRERTGYPTQKPRALLDRILGCATRPGDLVVDLFAGSGTTGESARALGRRALLGDRSPLALATSRARFLRAELDFELLAVGGEIPRGAAPEVRVTPAREGHVRVELEAPAEPLAWAVGAAFDPEAGFRATWHAERALGAGARSTAAAREAVVPRGALTVQVWHDDGSLGVVSPDARGLS